MAAPEYTTCVDPKDYDDTGIPDGFWSGLFDFIFHGGLDLLLLLCDYLLHGKLVCLGGDQCAIGRVASFETVEDKSGFEKIDNDFSINLALCPDPLGALQTGENHRLDNYTAAVANKQGWLITEQPNMPTPRQGSPDQKPSPKYAGTFVKIHTMLSLSNPIPEKISNESDSDTWHLPVFHTEIEGDRTAYVCGAANALWGPIHNTVCKIPLIGGFLCFILTLFIWPFIPGILAVLATAWAVGSNDNRDFDGGGDLKAGDLVLVLGRWVYDAGHQGWNELHPVKHIQTIPDDSACRWENFDDLKKRWCGEVSKIPQAPASADVPPKDSSTDQQATWDTQTRPENRWYFHPLVDGCTPKEKDPEPPK